MNFGVFFRKVRNVKSLTRLLNKAKYEGAVTNEWKIAIIQPIYKGG